MFRYSFTLNSQIPEYLTKLDAAANEGCQLVALQTQVLARALVHRDTGSLQDTIDTEKMESTDPHTPAWSVNAGNIVGGYRGGGVSDAPVGSPVDYALDQEYNLSGRGGPYMVPAAELAFATADQRFAERIGAIG